MPTYEYACTDCKNQWEEVQKISEDPIQVCPQCKNSTAKRQISGGNFILKGGGWYADLYSSSSPKKTDAKPESSSASEGKSGEAKAASSAPKAESTPSTGTPTTGSSS